MSALRAPSAVPGTRTSPDTRRRAPLTALPGGAGARGRGLDAVRAPLQATSGVPFVVLCAVLLVGALLTALLLNISMARGSYETAHLQQDVARVAEDVQTKQAELRHAESTLDDQARALGMVPAEDPTMVSVQSGSKVGQDLADEAGASGTP